MKLTHLLRCTRQFSARCRKAFAGAGLLAAFPFFVNAQQAYSVKIENGSLESAIAKVRNYTGDAIAYNKSDIGSLQVVSANYTTVNTDQLLKKIIAGLPVYLKK